MPCVVDERLGLDQRVPALLKLHLHNLRHMVRVRKGVKGHRAGRACH